MTPDAPEETSPRSHPRLPAVISLVSLIPTTLLGLVVAVRNVTDNPCGPGDGCRQSPDWLDAALVVAFCGSILNGVLTLVLPIRGPKTARLQRAFMIVQVALQVLSILIIPVGTA